MKIRAANCWKVRFIQSLMLLICLIISCDTDNKAKLGNKNQSMLYTILTAEQSGISFQNVINESMQMNGLFNDYLYNGAGISIADFNNDGLQDIFFVSNLQQHRLYLNTGKLKFKDISVESGIIDNSGFSTGVTVADINNDGWLDIYICKAGQYKEPDLRRNKLFINTGLNQKKIPVFMEDSHKYGLDIALSSTQAAFFDFDRDNDLDMFLINHYPVSYKFSEIEELVNQESDITGDKLYENRDGKYYDISKEAGLINNRLSYGLGLGVSDLNNDGWPDVYVSNDYQGKDYLYMNNKDGTFTEHINEAMYHISFPSMGNYLGDFNNDGWCDIITLDMVAEDNYTLKASQTSMDQNMFHHLVDMGQHYQYMFNTLQMNNGIFKQDRIPVFSDVAQLAGITNTDWSWGPLLIDMDNDGNKDLFISNGILRDFINLDYLIFSAEKQGELMRNQIKMNEYVYTVMSSMPERRKVNYFFKNNSDLTFEKMNGEWAVNRLTCSNGAAFGDLDNDGDLEIVVNNSDWISFIYKNNARENKLGNYVQFKLAGPEKNPIGIGTKIILKCAGKVQVQELHLTRGFQSSSSPVLHFGLDSLITIPEVQVIWPDGKTEILKNLLVNQIITLSYSNAKEEKQSIVTVNHLFQDVTDQWELNHKHAENIFDDFERELLLPHRMSNLGPGMAIGDVNIDRLEDFFIGGAIGYAGVLYIQTEEGFKKSFNQPFETDRDCEDVDAAFFDVDNDGDLDLYVVSGGNEYEEGSEQLQDRLYINTGSGKFIKHNNALSDLKISGSCVKVIDYDGDGDPDIFRGGRQKPGRYPESVSSTLLRNDSKKGKVIFTDVTKDVAPGFINLGMVTDAVFSDVNNDGIKDAIIVGEWMPIKIFLNDGHRFTDVTEKSGLDNLSGWWNCIKSADFDYDGDMDLVAGNLGLNYKYKAGNDHPFVLFAKDFDNNGRIDLVFGYYNNDTLYPLHGLRRSYEQLPFIRKKFISNNSFAKVTLTQVYGVDNLSEAINLQARNFASCYFENTGDGKFKIHRLPNPAQISSINDILIDDFDEDGNLDLVVAGNMYESEIEAAKNDAGIGMYLKGNGKSTFICVPANKSKLFIEGEVKKLSSISLGHNKQKCFIVAKNNGYVQIFSWY